MADPLELNFQSGVQLGGSVLPRPAIGGRGLGLDASFTLAVFTGTTGGGGGGGGTQMIVFGTAPMVGDTTCDLSFGTAGLVEAAWGTVLDVVEPNTGNIHVEENDQGGVIAVGLTAERRDITITCRLSRTATLPRRGTRFRARGRVFVAVEITPHFSNRAVTELTVTGSRWEDLNGMGVEGITGFPDGFNA